MSLPRLEAEPCETENLEPACPKPDIMHPEEFLQQTGKLDMMEGNFFENSHNLWALPVGDRERDRHRQ